MKSRKLNNYAFEATGEIAWVGRFLFKISPLALYWLISAMAAGFYTDYRDTARLLPAAGGPTQLAQNDAAAHYAWYGEWPADEKRAARIDALVWDLKPDDDYLRKPEKKTKTPLPRGN